MSTNIARMGPNSLAIGYSANTTIAEFLAAMTSALTAQGWELYDDAAPGGYVKVYRAPIADGTMAYKYLAIDLGSTANQMYATVYESWNAITHMGTNPAYYSTNSTNSQRVSFSTGGTMYVFATPRYALFFAKTSTGLFGNANSSSFCGIVEISRDNADEIPGQTPIFGWVEGAQLLGTQVGSSNCGCFSPVRTKSGATAATAWSQQSIGTVMGCSVKPSTALGNLLPAGADNFNPNNINAFNLYSIDQTANVGSKTLHLRGRLYGLKALSTQAGSTLDRLDLKVDSDMFFDPKSIDSIPHVVLTTSTFTGRFAIPL